MQRHTTRWKNDNRKAALCANYTTNMEKKQMNRIRNCFATNVDLQAFLCVNTCVYVSVCEGGCRGQ
jgi:hypothetical protein